eukprot:8890589-Pyramimonas_sp.AAC.1
MVYSESAVPFVKDIRQVRDVAWRPHAGLHSTFRSSGLQLITRILELLPSKLPQLPRPRTTPTP